MKLTIPEMSCGGCVQTIAQAITTVDDTATVQADLANRIIAVETLGSEAEIRAALESVGYPAS